MLKFKRTNPAPFAVYEAVGIKTLTRRSLTDSKLEDYEKIIKFSIERRGPKWRAYAGLDCLGELPTLRKAKAACQDRLDGSIGSFLNFVCS